MTTSQKFRLTTVSASLALLAACGSNEAANAPDGSEPASEEPAIIDERQDNFEAISDAFKAIRTQLEGSEPDLAAIEASAVEINERAQQIGGYFPTATGVDDGYDTEALASIWEEPAEFELAAQNLVDASAAMISAASTGDAAAVGAQVKELGGTCKACHDQFRLKTD